jgi:hypothetical protein
MWAAAEGRLALLELLTRGALPRRQVQTDAFEVLARLPWTRGNELDDTLVLVEDRRGDLVALLERVWGTWRDELAELTVRGLAPTPDGWRQLEEERRAAGGWAFSGEADRRTAPAIPPPDEKAAFGLTGTIADGSVRLRPPAGLIARTPLGTVDLAAVARMLGEVTIQARALLEGLVFEGPLRALLLVENQVAWRDLPAPAGWLLAHVPGWDTAIVRRLINRAGVVPVVFFGDLDPAGVRTFFHLRDRHPDLLWFVPPLWSERIERHGRAAFWPPDLDLRNTPPLVRQLAARGLGLAQERIALDDRIGDALEALVLGAALSAWPRRRRAAAKDR